MRSKLKALVVDDTVTYRKILSTVVSSFPEITRVDTAPSGAIALNKMERVSYNIVFLDMQMPGMDGNETLEAIVKRDPDISVAMVSAATEKGSKEAIRALNLGALDLIQKPQGKSPEESNRILRDELSVIVDAAIARQSTSLRVRFGKKTETEEPMKFSALKSIGVSQKKPVPKTTVVPAQFGIVAIGSSTGGPEALSRVIPKLEASFPLPIVIVQHMPPVFTAALAKDLDRKSKISVKEGEEGDAVLPGTALIAPGGIHMIVKNVAGKLVIGLDDGPKANSCKPSVDVLFESVAQAVSTKGVLATIMTGMGADGAKGVERLKAKSCYCLTQTASTCIVYGMPQAVDTAGLSDESVNLDDLASKISGLVSGRGGVR